MSTRKSRAKAPASEPGIVPERLREARIKKRWTQPELSWATRTESDPDNKLGLRLDTPLISRLENGTDRDIGISRARHLARVLGVSLDWLTGR